MLSALLHSPVLNWLGESPAAREGEGGGRMEKLRRGASSGELPIDMQRTVAGINPFVASVKAKQPATQKSSWLSVCFDTSLVLNAVIVLPSYSRIHQYSSAVELICQTLRMEG